MSTSSLRPQRFLPVAPAQEIQRGVVRDPEQPAFGIADRRRQPANASTALISASCSTSSPSITEPTMRAQ